MILLLKISLTKRVRFCIILNRGHRYLTFWFVFYIYFFSKSCGLSSTTNLVNTQKCSVYVTCDTQKNSKAPMSYIRHVLPSQHIEPTKFLIIPLTIILSRSIYALFFSWVPILLVTQCEIYILWDEDIYILCMKYFLDK